jgi:predicted AlkP superfamily phosphohydrolase/phosphomutase
MADPSPRKVSRRTFLKRSAIAGAAGAAAVGAGSYWLGSSSRASRSHGKKVIVIGIDGMDPVLCRTMMREGLLPNLVKLRDSGGFSNLGTSIPPQSPVAWANFITGADPGAHGIFDFVHRHPEHQCGAAFYGAAETVPGEGTVLRRQGVPFWDFLDEAGIPTTFYDLPCNYPPSPSKHGTHRCISGMGTPDMLGTYGTYQHFAQNGPEQPEDDSGSRKSRITFENETATITLVGPTDTAQEHAQPIHLRVRVHRDREANAAVLEVEDVGRSEVGGAASAREANAAEIEFQDRRIVLRPGEWSRWTKLSFRTSLPWYDSHRTITGICRFYLQEVAPNFRLYVTPINIDPSEPFTRISEPGSFIQGVSERLGLFYTTGFQEDYQARQTSVFDNGEFVRQATLVLEERLALFNYALQNYDDGLLFFYFSSSDLQSHLLWWNGDEPHPTRELPETQDCFAHVKRLYQRLDAVIGDVFDRYGSQATIIVMSDHGFANWGRQFNLNSWLRDAGYLSLAPECTSIMGDGVNWGETAAYGLGINGLYLNLKGRERDGIIEPGAPQQALLTELAQRLEAVEDNGRRVIRKAYRADQVYHGNATALAPDLIVGYHRGYRASWESVGGKLTEEIFYDNNKPWSADHCAAAEEVPGVLFCNRPIRRSNPALIDVAPGILAEFGLATPSSMAGVSIFS